MKGLASRLRRLQATEVAASKYHSLEQFCGPRRLPPGAPQRLRSFAGFKGLFLQTLISKGRADRRLAMGMQVGDSKGGAIAEMNVVPLIDILLVLLIIFMVITPLTPKGLDTLVPQPNPNQQQNQDLENKTVVVQITKDSKVKINNEDSTWEGLGPRIEQIFKDRAEKVAFVKGDNEVLFQEVARAIDIMRSAGIDKVGLITAKLEAGQ
jgi:biopolymer transport protein TolR